MSGIKAGRKMRCLTLLFCLVYFLLNLIPPLSLGAYEAQLSSKGTDTFPSRTAASSFNPEGDPISSQTAAKLSNPSNQSSSKTDPAIHSTAKTANTVSWSPSQAPNSDQLFIFDSERGSKLYGHNEAAVSTSPLCLNLMLALLSLEKLNAQFSATASAEAARISDAEYILNVDFNSGEKYNLNFILYALILYDSKAARHILIEALGQGSDAVLSLMNGRARTLGMDTTKFSLDRNQSIECQSTPSDTAQLLRQAYSISQFKRIFETKSEIYIEEGAPPLVLSNRVSMAWTWSNNVIQGASMADAKDHIHLAYVAKGKDFNIFILQNYAIPDKLSSRDGLSQAIREANHLVEEVFSAFERTLLTRRGDFCQDIVQQDNIRIRLVYLETTYYIKAVTATNVVPQMKISLPAQINLPIVRNTSLGQITIVLPDQSRYYVNVGSDRDIISENTAVDRFFNTLQTYPSILQLALLLSTVFVLLLIYRLINYVITKIALHNEDRSTQWRRRR